jgi:hypothetical protein
MDESRARLVTFHGPVWGRGHSQRTHGGRRRWRTCATRPAHESGYTEQMTKGPFARARPTNLAAIVSRGSGRRIWQ